jgi:hypothetical protein
MLLPIIFHNAYINSNYDRFLIGQLWCPSTYENVIGKIMGLKGVWQQAVKDVSYRHLDLII